MSYRVNKQLCWTFGFLLLYTILVFNVITNLFLQNAPSREDSLKKDWHDYKFMVLEMKRTGIGEQGEGYVVSPIELEKCEEEYAKTGYYVSVSNMISVNRSIPDSRHEDCLKRKYLSNLPSVSIVSIFYNEVFSVLLRTLHGIVNRTPPELLHEIILVNDNSTLPELYEPLQDYVDKNFPNLVKILYLKERKGLIVARAEGARAATGEILVFFDAHTEVNANWLPPLIEPIALNRRIATEPVIDNFESSSFQYHGDAKNTGSRGGFDWNWIYKWLPKLPGTDNIEPFPTPIMLGCAFAINRKYFWELGGYDEGLQVWNGENYELSFKLWLCGDGLLQIPCSRVAHTFRGVNPSRNNIQFDFLAKNFKRVAEVWMDEFKDILYGHSERFKNADAGDISKQILDREKCKPFKYFLEKVAPDILMRYPPIVYPPKFASGTIKSLANSSIDYCLDSSGKSMNSPITLEKCDNNLTHPSNPSQSYDLSFFKHIVETLTDHCLDSYNLGLYYCHFTQGNQYWEYDTETQLLINNGICLAANISTKTIFLETCDENLNHQKWKFGYLNESALSNWDNIYGYKEYLSDFDF